MKRFLKTLTLLVVGLLLLVSGVDAALDHLALSPGGGSLTIYGQQGQVLMAYEGNFALLDKFGHPLRFPLSLYQPHRG